MISQHVTNDKYNFNQRRLDAAIKILDIIQKSLDKK